MRAVGLRRHLPAQDDASLLDLELPEPSPGPHDLLVRVEAVSVNPIDTKVRAGGGATSPAEDPPRILGFDAAGMVAAVGPACELFAAGDPVYYAGALSRPGSNAELQVVDERLVGHRPRSLSAAQAAALPLTALTAWESLFDRMAIDEAGADAATTLLVIGGAGGVGSMAVQLAARAGLTVVATASRPESAAWATEQGAHHVVDHRLGLPEALAAVGLAQVDWILCAQRTDLYWEQMAEVVRPQGGVCCLVDSPVPLTPHVFKPKSVSVSWASMFTRSAFQTPDMVRQHEILDLVTEGIDRGELRTTMREDLGPVTAAQLREAHRRVESGTTIGKIVLSGWPQ